MAYSRIFSIRDEKDFNEVAVEIFHYQYLNNIVYASFCRALGREPRAVKNLLQIPFLPIDFFKTKDVLCQGAVPDTTFYSSGTTGANRSRHLVADLGLYQESISLGFRHFFGEVKDYKILALLPAYMENPSSSLVYMAGHLMQAGGQEISGFYHRDAKELYRVLHNARLEPGKTLLLGVSFALLDFAERFPINWPELIVMETGGMKGKRKEITRGELHEQLKSAFGVEKIYSEYGMTELLSQAYSLGEGVFDCPPWMKILLRDSEDPLSWANTGRTGGINVIDLANLHSCSFLATQDLGRLTTGGFEVLGRFDHSDIRGCSLLSL